MATITISTPVFLPIFISQYEAAKIAQAEEHNEEYEFFEKSKHDERRHEAGIKKIALSKFHELEKP